MLLAIDVGNTQTVLGVFENDKLRCHFRISTGAEKTADELAVTFADLLALRGLGLKNLTAVIISSVVPHLTTALEEMAGRILKVNLLTVGPGVKTGISILYDNPREVGADRIANAVAVHHLYGGPAIIVDFGTATTFDVVSRKGEYLGGVIAPGVEVSANALFTKAAKLSRVELVKPEAVVGKNTIASLQSGIIFGFAGQVDGLIERIKKELGDNARVIATGGLAELMVPECKSIELHDPLLTLTGLGLIYQRNI